MEHGVAMNAAVAQAAHVVIAAVLADDAFDADMQQSLAAFGALALVHHVDFLRVDRVAGCGSPVLPARVCGLEDECGLVPGREQGVAEIFREAVATPPRPGVVKNSFIVRASAGANAMLLWSAVRSSSTLGGRGRELIRRCVLAGGMTVSCPARTTRDRKSTRLNS